MKRLITGLVVVSALVATIPTPANDDLQSIATDTENLWRTGSGAHDGAYSAVSMSMIGWGVGLAILIGVLAATLSHGAGSSGGSSHAHTHCH